MLSWTFSDFDKVNLSYLADWDVIRQFLLQILDPERRQSQREQVDHQRSHLMLFHKVQNHCIRLAVQKMEIDVQFLAVLGDLLQRLHQELVVPQCRVEKLRQDAVADMEGHSVLDGQLLSVQERPIVCQSADIVIAKITNSVRLEFCAYLGLCYLWTSSTECPCNFLILLVRRIILWLASCWRKRSLSNRRPAKQKNSSTS